MLVGIAFFFLYYVIFTFLIKYFNLNTIGRESENGETKLYTKNEYQQKIKNKQSENINADTIIDALGGEQNIKSVENCYTRLRLVLNTPELVDENLLKNHTGASAVIKMGNNVQVVYGLQVNAIRKAVDSALMQLRNVN